MTEDPGSHSADNRADYEAAGRWLVKLGSVLEQLRGDNGCPWDRKQDYTSIKASLIEEAYETAEAVDGGRVEDLREELGDLLFVILFYHQIAAERGDLCLADTVAGVYRKIVSRHPHVFGDDEAADADDVLRNWERIKRKEKTERTSVLDGIPRNLPALMTAQKLLKKAARAGFHWRSDQAVQDKVSEEAAELREALDRQDTDGIAEEIGDLMFTLTALAERHDLNASDVLQRANQKFSDRFRRVETAAGGHHALAEKTEPELLRLYDEAKATPAD